MPERTGWRRYAERALNAVHLPITVYIIWIGSRTLGRAEDSPVIAAAFPMWLTIAWASALVLGGVLIVLGVLCDSGRVESAGHGFHLSGLGIYLALAIIAGLIGSGLFIVVGMFAGVSLLRLRQLAKSREAQAAAGEMLTGEA